MAQSGLKWATPAIKTKYHKTSGSKIIFKELCFPPIVFPHHLLSLPAYTTRKSASTATSCYAVTLILLLLSLESYSNNTLKQLQCTVTVHCAQ
jgi:hypothetical protein